MRLYPGGRSPKHDRRAAYFEVEYEEVFHLKELYKNIHEWLEQWGFQTLGKVGEKEKLYMELVNDKGAKNHHIWWRCERIESNYIKYFLKIDYQTLNMNSIEIMHKGKKKKTHKGDVILRVEGWLMLDYKDEWKDHWFLKHFDNWFVSRWYKNIIEQHRKELWFEVYNLEDTIKQHLTLNTPFDMPEPWFPKKGMG